MNVADVLHFEPEALVTVDFESFYDNDFQLRRLTTEAYVRDARFEAIGVGVKVDGGKSVWLEEKDFQSWAAGVPWKTVAVLAHHYAFDGLILSHRFDIVPGFCFDTLSMARANNGAATAGGSLAALALQYGVGEKGTEVVNAKGKRRKDFTSEEWLRYGEYCANDCELTYAIFQKMLEQGFPETELWNIDATVRMFTEPKLRLNQAVLGQLIETEKQRKAALLGRIAKDRSVLMSNEKFAALLTEMGEEPPRKISPRTGKETWAFAKSDPGMQSLLDHENDDLRWVAEARVAVKSTINETRAERLLNMGKRGPAAVYLKYCGAHTHRWSGGDLSNWQNFKRGGALRDAVEAPEGEVLVVADSGQIEARVLAWLSGHEALLEAFAQDRDLYNEIASEIYRRPIDRKGRKEDKVPGHVAKCMALGLGYQMGFGNFSATLLAGMLGGPPVQFAAQDAENLGVDVGRFAGNEDKMARVRDMPSRVPLAERVVHCAVADHLVAKYRKKNAPITKLWRFMNDVLGAMVDGVEGTFGPGECIRTVRHGIVLPSGLTMGYRGLRRLAEEDGGGFAYLGGKSGKESVRAYGGSMTENVVQALARIVVADQMLYIRAKYGYPILLMTHDEICTSVPEAEGELALSRMLSAMKTPPHWAKGLPLNAEGGVAKSYGGAK